MNELSPQTERKMSWKNLGNTVVKGLIRIGESMASSGLAPVRAGMVRSTQPSMSQTADLMPAAEAVLPTPNVQPVTLRLIQGGLEQTE